jgi:hypothetical protein
MSRSRPDEAENEGDATAHSEHLFESQEIVCLLRI